MPRRPNWERIVILLGLLLFWAVAIYLGAPLIRDVCVALLSRT